VTPIEVKGSTSWIHWRMGGSGGDRTRRRRSITPMGFSRAVYLANA